MSLINNYLDYVPIVGPIWGAVQLITRDHVPYHARLGPGSALRVTLLAIPVFGNLGIFFYDWMRRRAIRQVLQNSLAFADMSEMFKDDPAVAKVAICQNEDMLQFVTRKLQASLTEEIAQGVHDVRENGLVLQNLGWLRGVRSVVLEAVRQNGYALRFASTLLKGDREIVWESVERKGSMLGDASLELRNDRALVLKAVSQNGEALLWASDYLKNDEEVVLTAILQNPRALIWASAYLQANKAFLQKALQKNGAVLEYIHEALQSHFK